LIDVAQTRNQECQPPLPEKEIMRVAASAWDYTQANKNHYGQHGAYVRADEAVQMISDPDVLALLVYLRSTQGPWARFAIPNALAEQWGWDRKRFAASRARLIEQGYLRLVRAAFTGHAALFQWDD
jgi:Primase C terminal 1 (PriCT-1)